MLSRIRKSNDDQGFTLIELLVVIIIIGILAAIAIPVFLNQRKKGWDAAVKSDLRNAATSEETFLTATGAYTDSVDTNAAAVTPPVGLSDVGFKYSADSNYAGAPAVASITATFATGSSYCLTAQSASDVWFAYGSDSGLQEYNAQPGNTAGVCTAP